MKKVLRVNVTAKDIRDGVPGTDDQCPIALALHRAVRSGGRRPARCSVDVSVCFVGRRHIIDTPPRVSDFIARFDSLKPVRPFRFQLEIE